MLVVVAPDGGDRAGGGWLRAVEGPEPAGRRADLAAGVAEWEAAHAPRWIWSGTTALYPALLRAGVRVGRCHDLELTEALLLGHAGRWGQPRGVGAVLARRDGRAVPADPPAPPPRPPGPVPESLFELTATGADDPAPDLITAYADQQARIAALPEPARSRFRLLVAAESAGALVAAELGHTGLPWRADRHDRILTELLGPRSPVGGPPRRLAALAAAIGEALGVPGLHPDSPAELLRALRRAGLEVPDTRAWSLRGLDHPVVPLLLEFKELYRVWTAHGWSWCETWVHEGRFRPEYVPGGVVSGRWATRGGGALQIPKVIRGAVVADPGWRFVVADAGQLEPRILAAVSGDPRLAAAAGAGDLYAALAAESFAGDRARAKLALLGAMYGQTGGAALPALAVLRQRYPTAWRYVEEAARIGAAGGLVRSWLGRTAPAGAGPDPAARGRFTRNFVIQATAAEWALTLLAVLRTELARLDPTDGAELVFFQHDEVLVHCREDRVAAVRAAVTRAGEAATRLLFGPTPVQFPLRTVAVSSYAEAG